MKKKAIFYTGFFVVLFVGFYFVLTKIIPGFGEKKLPVLSYVQPFQFVNQYGDTIQQQNMTGKVYVAEYFFTSCKGICPKMNQNMKDVYSDFRNEREFFILSHTVDPDTDSVGRMRRYSDSMGVAGSNWWFLTGRKDSLYNAARVSYLLDASKTDANIEDQFMHTQLFALVDRSGRVRKIYDGLKKDELAEMKKDIPKLLNEKEVATFSNSLYSNNPN